MPHQVRRNGLRAGGRPTNRANTAFTTAPDAELTAAVAARAVVPVGPGKRLVAVLTLSFSHAFVELGAGTGRTIKPELLRLHTKRPEPAACVTV